MNGVRIRIPGDVVDVANEGEAKDSSPVIVVPPFAAGGGRRGRESSLLRSLDLQGKRGGDDDASSPLIQIQVRER